jgi:site-specific DNA recombinase
MNKTINKVALYMRSSTNEDDKGGIKRQDSALIDFVIANNLIITEKYVDEGVGGNVIDRPALNQLRADMGEKKFDAVLIYDPTILARTSCFYEVLLSDFTSHKIETIFVTTQTPVTPEEVLIDKMKMVFTEYQDRLKRQSEISS